MVASGGVSYPAFEAAVVQAMAKAHGVPSEIIMSPPPNSHRVEAVVRKEFWAHVQRVRSRYRRW